MTGVSKRPRGDQLHVAMVITEVHIAMHNTTCRESAMFLFVCDDLIPFRTARANQLNIQSQVQLSLT